MEGIQTFSDQMLMYILIFGLTYCICSIRINLYCIVNVIFQVYCIQFS